MRYRPRHQSVLLHASDSENDVEVLSQNIHVPIRRADLEGDRRVQLHEFAEHWFQDLKSEVPWQSDAQMAGRIAPRPSDVGRFLDGAEQRRQYVVESFALISQAQCAR